MFKNILVAIDGGELSMKAGQRAIELAKIAKGKLISVMVCPSFQQLKDKGYLAPILDENRSTWELGVAERARTILERFATQARADDVACGTVIVADDNPYHAIIDTAKVNECDLIVMGSHGYGGFNQLVLGSQTTRVLSHTKLPVLVCR